MQETIGQRLKREREARYLSVEKAAAETRIRKVFLQALEADDFSVMPSAAQGRGFLRNYAEYLHLNVDELISELQRNPVGPAEEEVSGPLPQVNLAETELPPLTETEEEEPAPPFWTRILKRKPKPESTPKESPAPEEATEVEKILSADVQEEPSAEIPFDGQNRAEFKGEAQQGLLGRLTAWVGTKLRRQNKVSAVVPSIEIEQPSPVPAQMGKPADIIMAEIGATLRERRELISLTVEEVELHTHLRAVFVKALEEGAFDKLPSTVQTRGMLSNYASFLDLDVDTVLLRYADALQARRHEKYVETPREKIQTQVTTSMPALRTFIAGDLLFGVLMITVILGLAIWGMGYVINLRGAEVQPTVPPIDEVLGISTLATASPQLTFVAVDDPAFATGGVETFEPEAVTSALSANVTVNIFALERVFIRVSVDGKTAFEGRLAPRESKLFEANDQVVILTGDGSALRITYNGQDLGLMGGPGEVVNRVYLITGVATPTATIPPTVTNTPLVTSTPVPTITSTATSTPSGE